MTNTTSSDVHDGEHTDQYLRIIDAAPDAMLIADQDWHISFLNVQTERLFGYARADLLGKSLDVLIPEFMFPQHRAQVSRYLAEPAVRASGAGIELFGRRADKTEIAIEVSLGPVQTDDGLKIAVCMRDVSERKLMEAISKLNAERLVSAVESIHEAFALYDADDRLVLCNRTYIDMGGDSMPQRPVGMTYADIFRASLSGIAFDSEEEKERYVQERLVQRQHRGASTKDIRTTTGRSVRLVDRRTNEGGIVTTAWDLTEEIVLAEELRRARAAAEAASNAKSEFLSSMSHEMRTPMNAILGFAQLLRRDKKDPLPAKHLERVERILRGGEHLLRLIDDILDLSRIEAGGVSISTEAVDVAEILDELQTTLGETASRNQVTLELLNGQSHIVAADRTRFAQILMNFGSNAIKYNRPGGRVTFAVSAHDSFVRVNVIDTGMGIPLDKQDRLFQPFQRAGQESGPIEGTGIGLVISKRLAELMGGRVGFRSTSGVGSEFWVDIPVHDGVRASISIPAGDVAAVRLGGGDRRILYIEDNRANVVFMRDLVSEFDGLELLVAPTAEMGIELANDHDLDAIIMDINLPGMSGVQALRALREIPRTKSIPVIALTAAASERDKKRGLQEGFFRYLTKPVKVEELLSVLELILTKPAP